MIAVLDLITALLTFGLGFFSGRLVGRRKNRAPRAPVRSKSTCGCGCERAFHDPKTGECHTMVNGEPTRFNEWDRPVAWRQVKCPCQQYDGPPKTVSAEDIIAGFHPPHYTEGN